MNTLLIGLLALNSAFGATPTSEELKAARDWADAVYSSTGSLFGSFSYGDKVVAAVPKGWENPKEKTASARVFSSGTSSQIEFAASYKFHLKDPGTKLKVSYNLSVCADFPVVECTVSFKNEGDRDTPVISDLAAIDTALDIPGDITLFHNKGDNCTADSYAPLEDVLAPGKPLHIANTGGRPTQTAFPYFNIGGDHGGVIYALAWPGQWFSDFERLEKGGVRVRGGQENVHLVLHPGEEIRGPRVVLLFYKGDRLRAQNVWRSWMLAHNTPRPGGALPPSPQLAACSSHQFGEMIHADTASQKFFIDKYLERGMKLDYWWMDAGWYKQTEGWPQTGTWEVDEARFPGGLRPISDYAHAKGVNTIVWFEPERVAPKTWLSTEHPEWISGGKNGGLLDLGNADARSWLTDHVDGLLTSQGIDLYRQDFNMDPLEAWRADEPKDRQGMREIRHVEGYLAYWDALRAKHPNMLIDSCASGGRRNDLETLRRAVPLLRSDYIMEPTGNQAQTWAMSSWLPYYGTGTSKTSAYEILSVMCPHFTACWDMRDGKLDYALLSGLVAKWKEFAPYFLGDYYPLTKYTLDTHDWIAWQFHDAAKNAGMVQAFRREANGQSDNTFTLHGLDENATYALRDLNGVVLADASGSELMQKGISVSIVAQPGATVITYGVK